MTHRDDALQDILAIARHHGITAHEIAEAMHDPQPLEVKRTSGVLSKLFGYIGGIFVFAGIGVFISMYWADFGSAARVVVTLGTGFSAFLMALACLTDRRYERAATPLLLIALLLQPMGIFVMLDEFSAGGDPRHGVLFMATYMLIQQGATFIARQLTVSAFAAIFFGSVFCVTSFDLWDIDGKLVGAVMGSALMCMAYALSQSRHRAIASFWHLVGSIALLIAVFEAVEDTPYELLFLGLTAFIIYLSTAIRSGALMLVGTLAMLGYIGYFTAQHFADTLGWPIALVIIGIAMICVSAAAVRLNNKYIRSNG